VADSASVSDDPGVDRSSIPNSELARWAKVQAMWSPEILHEKWVRDMLRAGIPEEIRGRIWLKMIGSRDTLLKNPGVFWSLVEMDAAATGNDKVEKLIRNDISRTFPEGGTFEDPEGAGQTSLFSVLKAYSLFDRRTGYCQGMNFIAATLLMRMSPEMAFWSLVELMKSYELVQLFRPGVSQLQTLLFIHDQLLAAHYSRLSAHLETLCFGAHMYAKSWFLTLFAYDFPPALVAHIWDIYLADRDYLILLKFSLAVLAEYEDRLLSLGFEGLHMFLRKLPESEDFLRNQDAVVRAAFRLRLDRIHIRELEQEFMAKLGPQLEDDEESIAARGYAQ